MLMLLLRLASRLVRGGKIFRGDVPFFVYAKRGFGDILLSEFVTFLATLYDLVSYVHSLVECGIYLVDLSFWQFAIWFWSFNLIYLH